MSWQVLPTRNVQCQPVNPDTTFTAEDNTVGYNVAVALSGDSDGSSVPMPTIYKSTTVGDYIYGTLVVWDNTAKLATVATGGILEFEKATASVAGDIGRGIVPDTTTAGKVDTGAGAARGRVVARNGNSLFVDMQVGAVTNS